MQNERDPYWIWAQRLDESNAEGDNVDYRAMLAREVKAERTWRIFNYKQKPRDSLAQELFDGEPLRVAIERSNGENLA